jgi:hypothetical protein
MPEEFAAKIRPQYRECAPTPFIERAVVCVWTRETREVGVLEPGGHFVIFAQPAAK